jgi:transcriptional regulator EpsA
VDDLSQLPEKTQNHLVRALDAAKQLRSSADFFLWSQGQLCVLLEHRILLGALLDEQHKVVYLECLQSVPVKPDLLEALKDQESGYLARLARHNQDQRPISVGDGAGANPQPDGLSDGLRQEWAGFGLGRALFIGTGPIPGGLSSYFGFLCLPAAPTPAQALMTRALLPQMHLALLRASSNPTPGLLALGAEDQVELTDRQLEILHWVKMGKTNFEIAMIIGISALTVKNHLQKLFKRLNVHNRTQAVAYLMSTQALQQSGIAKAGARPGADSPNSLRSKAADPEPCHTGSP